MILPAASAFSTSALVTGKVYASDYAVPTPANLTTAVLDMQTAYTDAAGRASTVTELGAGNIGGLTLVPGVYKWGTDVTISTNLTLSGGADDVWIFQIAQNLTVSSGVKIVLAGGAQAKNVFWQIAGQTTIGTTAVFNGNILDQTTIVLNTGATLNGRALAQTAVTLDSNTVTMPGSATPTPTPTPTPTYTTTPSSSSTQTTTQAPATPSATNAALQVKLNGLRAVLHDLQAQQAVPNPLIPLLPDIRAIAVNLAQGSRDTNVGILQEFLISQNKGSSAQALASVGATGYFGVLTRAALAEFQQNVGITPTSGYFGAKTRAYITASILPLPAVQ